MPTPDKIDQLYDALKADGAVSKSRENFRSYMLASGKQGYVNRKQLYDALKADGAVESATYDEFRDRLGLHAVKPQQPVAKPSSTPQSVQQQPKSQPKPQKAKQQPKKTAWKPTPAQQRQFQQTINSAQQTIQNVNERHKNMAEYSKQRMKHPFGQPQVQIGLNRKNTPTVFDNRNLVQGRDEFNPKTGKLEPTYLTASGNKYNSKVMADAEQRQIDDAIERELHPIETQLRDAYAERDRLNKLAQERVDELEKSHEELPWYLQLGEYANSDKMPDAGSPMHRWDNDMQYKQYMAALRKNRALITTLEDKRSGKMNEFWHTLGNEITNGYTFSLAGKAQMDDVAALTFAQKHVDTINRKRQKGEALTKEEQAAEAVLKNAEWDNRVQSQYGDEYGAWARAGKMGAVSLDLMMDFALMGGQPLSLAKSIAGGTGKLATKLIGNAATKGFGKFMVKATGATLGSMVAGAEIANTVGVGRTMSDAVGRYQGDIILDENGDYVFGHFEDDGKGGQKLVKGGDSFIGAVLGAERTAIAENGSEIAGAFLPGGKVLLKGLEKIGLSKIASGLTSLSGKQWYAAYSRALQTAGFNGVPGEALEEYVGTGFDALMGGEEWKNLADKRTHVDIWLGCATMGALLNAPRIVGTGYQMAQYYRYKHNTDKSDSLAETRLGNEAWEPLRQQIDEATNGQITDVLLNVLDNENLDGEQKKAVAEYAANLQRMRGYSLGRVSSEQRDDEHQPTQRELDEQTLEQSYTQGYGATDIADMQDIKHSMDYQHERVASFADANLMSVLDGSPMDAIDAIRSNEQLSDEQKQIAIDYVNARNTHNALLQRINDDADVLAEEDRELFKQMQHKTDGSLRPAVLKEKNSEGNDQQVYIVDGNVQMMPDGSVVDKSSSDNIVVIYNPATGERKQIDPSADTGISTLGETFTAEDYEAGIEQKRQNYVKTMMDDVNGIIRPEVGQQVVYNGEPITVTGVFDDGGIVASREDGTVITASHEELQQEADEISYADYLQRNGSLTPDPSPKGEGSEMPQAGAGDVVAGAPADYTADMELTIRDEDGTEKPATVMGRVRYENGSFVPDANGNIVEYESNGETLHDHITALGDKVVSHTEERAVPTEMPQYYLNDDVYLQTEDGEIHGNVIAEENPDGLITIQSEQPIGGRIVNLFTREQLDSMTGNNAVENISPQVNISGENIPQEPVEAPVTPSEPTQTEQPTAEPMPMIGEGEDAEPDFGATTPQRAHDYIFNESGLDEADATEFTKNNVDAANKELEKIKNRKPKMGTSIAKFNKDKAVWERKVNEAQAKADYWKQVKAARDKVLADRLAEQQERERQQIEQAQADEAAYREEMARKEAEQAALGTNNVSPAIREKWASAPKVEGAQDEIVLPNGEKVAGRYYLVESGAASASHDSSNGFVKTEGFPVDENGGSVNDRDYERDKDAQQVTRDIANNYDSRAVQTPVVVSQDGVVLSGNGRTMAGELAAAHNTDAAYNSHIAQYPTKWGFTKQQVEGMQHPRVVFVPDASMPYTAETFAKFNQQEMKGQSKTEQAVKLGKVVSDKAFNRIIRIINRFDTLGDFYSDSKATSEAIAELQGDGVLSQAQLAEMVDGGGISAIGKELLENTLIGKAFESNPNAVREITEYKSMRQSIITALAEISNNLSLDKEYSLESELAQAIDLVYQARKSGSKLGEPVSWFARQQNLDFFGLSDTVADYNNATMLMIADIINDNRSSLLKKYIQIYNHNAKDSANGQLDLFTGSVKGKGDIINEVKQLFSNGNEEEQQKAAQEAVARRKAESIQENGTVANGSEGSYEDNDRVEETPAEQTPTEEDGSKPVMSHDEKMAFMRQFLEDTAGDMRLLDVVTDEEVQKLIDLYDAWEVVNDGLGAAHDANDALLNDKNKAIAQNAKKNIETAENAANAAFAPVEDYYNELCDKYGITDEEEPAANATGTVTAAITEAEAATEVNPTDAQKEAGNYKKGHVRIDGFEITIENPKGSVRRGTDASGKQWEQKMNNTYGYIRGTEGVDGDHIDVFFSEDPSQGDVFVVDQVNKDGSFDEHKVMYGFPDIESARKAYLSNYEDGWQGLGAITPVSKEEFKKWVNSSHRKTKPFAEYSSVKPLGDTQLGEQTNKPTVKTDEDYVSMAERRVLEEEAKRNAAGFATETPDEAAAFDKRVPEMNNAELLAYMQADGNGDVNKAHHPNVYDEYDYRHGDEQLQSYDDTLVRLNESGTTLEQAEEMLANIQKDVSRLATEDRAMLLGQEEALQEYIAGLEKEGERDVAIPLQQTEQNVYEPTTTYETRDGKKVVWRSLFDEMDMRGEDETTETSLQNGKVQNPTSFNPSEFRLRKLEAGETCHVERVYEETKQFDFTGKEKVESAEDVAYIFRQLENAAVENSFLVLVKDGRPTVIHLGVGSYIGVMAPYEQALVAYRELKPEQVYFVHNHPSGTLKASRQDQDVLNRMKRAFGEDVVQQGIIIDTTSGNYGEFESIETADETYSVEEEMPQSKGAEVPIKVYQFSRQVFAPDWNPESAFKIVSSQSVAEFVSSHRLGEHKKMSFLVVNNNGNVVANVFLPWTKLSDVKSGRDAGELLAGYVHQCGGVRGVLYGNYDYESDDREVLASVGGRMRQLNAPLMDALHVEHNAYENGWVGVGEPNEASVRDALIDVLRGAGVEVVTDVEEGQRVLDEANDGARMQAKKRALETASVTSNEKHQPTVVSSADGVNDFAPEQSGKQKANGTVKSKDSAKIQNILDNLVSYYEKRSNYAKGFITDIAKSLSMKRRGSSNYCTFELPNGNLLTVRLSKHNANVSNFDSQNELEGISIVVSPHINKKMKNKSGDKAHVVEFYYSKKEIENVKNGKPLAEILKSIKDALITGIFKDTTGLAERQEVNGRELMKLVGLKMQKKPMDAEEQKHKETQLSIINDTNPAPDDYHTWVRSIDDILTLHEAVDAVLAEDPEYELSTYPDVSDDIIREALRTGRITIYSSKPIKNGVFVTPSMMQAMDYSGGTKVFSKEVPIRDVAWINTDEGQYTATSGEASSKDKEMRFFRTTDGHAYGFTKDGKIYIDPRIATAETPIHEYSHLWAAAFRKTNPKEWANIVELMKDTAVWDEVVNTYPELKTDDEIADEVLAQYSGRRGAERLRAEQEKIAKGEGDVFEKAEAISALNRVRYALKRFWNGVADWFGIHFTTAEEVADKVLSDLLHGVRPAAKLQGTGAEILARAKADGKNPDIRYQFVGEKGAAAMDKAEEASVRLDNLAVAREMENAGKDAKAVKLATGWERGGDGKWRYEIEDFDSSGLENLVREDNKKKLRLSEHRRTLLGRKWEMESEVYPDRYFDEFSDAEREQWDRQHTAEIAELNDLSKEIDRLKKQEESSDIYTDLGTVVGKEHVLFKYYPELEGAVVHITDMPSSVGGNYKPGVITLNRGALYDSSILNHEVQHAIQEIEGFARGGSVRDVRKRIMKRISELDNVSEHAKEMLARQVEYRALASKLGYVYERLMKNGEDWAVKAASGFYWDAMNTLDNDENSTLENAYPKGMNASEIAKEGFNRDKAIEELNRLSDYYASQISADDMNNIKESEALSDKIDGKSDEELYHALDGEVEARNVQNRLGMTAEERRASLASETEDVARDDQIFLEDGLGESMSESTAAATTESTDTVRYRIPENEPLTKTHNAEKNRHGLDVLSQKSTRVYSAKERREREAYAERQWLRAHEVANEIIDKLNISNDITVYESIDEVPGSEDFSAKRRRAKGWYDPRTNKIVVVLGNHRSPNDVLQTILHEAVAHYGLRKLFGKNFETFLDNVYKYADMDVHRRIINMAANKGWDIREATEEYLASLAEDTDFDNAESRSWAGHWFNKIKQLFLDMLHHIGLRDYDGVSLTDNELRYILWRSYKNLAEPGHYRNYFSIAEDTVMQSNLHVGYFTEETGQTIEQSTKVAESGLMFRDGDFSPRDRAIARDTYERMVSTGGYQFQEAVQDSMLGLKRLYQSILGKGTRMEDVDGFENAYWAENRMTSTTAAQQYEYYVRYMKPLLKAISDIVGSNNGKRLELTDYMMAKHGLERNVVMAQRDFDAYKQQYPYGTKTLDDFRERDYAGLTALTGEDDVAMAELAAQQMVDTYEQDHDTSELWQRVNDATSATLAKIYNSGLLSKERYEQIQKMFKYYIPLQGWDETTSDEVYGYLTSKNGPLGGSPIKHAKGRSSKADDPIATIALMADDAIRQGNRNVMKQTFLNFVLNHQSDLVSVNDLWLQYNAVMDEWEPVFADIENTDTAADVERKVEAFEERMQQLAKSDPDNYKRGRDAQNIPYKVVKDNLKEHQVLVRRNGRTYVLTINGNPRAAQALNGLTNPDVETGGVVGNLMKGAEWLNRNLSAFYTTRNPDFVASNFLRDMLYSNCMTWVKESPKYALRFHKNFGRVNPANMRILFGKWANGTLDESNYIENLFKQFMLNGGETGYTNIKDIEGHKRDIAAELKRNSSNTRKAWQWLGEQLDLLNRSVENCARFAAFVTSREEGRSIERSIYDAKEISVNFNKKGSGGKMVNATGQTLLGKVGSYVGGGGRLLYVFWNAGVQAITNFARAAKRNPKKAIAGAAIMYMFGAVIRSLAQAMGGDDDDDKNAYNNLPEYVRRSNIIINAGNQWIAIPLPIEFRAFYGLGELAAGVITGNERYSDSELAFQMGSQISQILPLDMLEGGGGINPFVPSIAKPFVEAYIMNKSWSGLPVYKDSPWNKNNPEWTKAYKSANTYLVSGAKWLNEISGGDDYKKGYIDINPAKVEYLLSGIFGGAFTTGDKLVKMGETIFSDREFDWRNMLIANRVVKTGDERTANRKLSNEYFKYKDEYEETKRLLKKYSDEAATNERYKHRLERLQQSEEYLLYDVFDNYQPILKNLHDAKDGADEATLKSIENEENALRRDMVDLMHAIEDDEKPDINAHVDAMLKREFEAGGRTQKPAGSRIAKRLGGTDSYGSPQNEYGQVYLQMRDYVDLAEDVMLQAALKKAKDSGNTDRAKDIESARRQITEVKKDLTEVPYTLSDGTEVTAKDIMQELRDLRKNLLNELGITTQQQPNR